MTPPQAQTSTIATKSIKDNVLPPLLDQQIDRITKDLPPNYARNLRALNNQQNISTIVKYIQAITTETSVSAHYKWETIDILRRFSKFNHEKNFADACRYALYKVVSWLSIIKNLAIDCISISVPPCSCIS
jgi:hypothetical protein